MFAEIQANVGRAGERTLAQEVQVRAGLVRRVDGWRDCPGFAARWRLAGDVPRHPYMTLQRQRRAVPLSNQAAQREGVLPAQGAKLVERQELLEAVA